MPIAPLERSFKILSGCQIVLGYHILNIFYVIKNVKFFLGNKFNLQVWSVVFLTYDFQIHTVAKQSIIKRCGLHHGKDLSK